MRVMGKRKKSKKEEGKTTKIEKQKTLKKVNKKRKQPAKQYTKFIKNQRKSKGRDQSSLVETRLFSTNPDSNLKSFQSWKTIIDTVQDVVVVDMKYGYSGIDFGVGKKTTMTKKGKASENVMPGKYLDSSQSSVVPSTFSVEQLFEIKNEDDSSVDSAQSDDVYIVDMGETTTGTAEKVPECSNPSSILKQVQILKHQTKIKEKTSFIPKSKLGKFDSTNEPSTSPQMPKSNQHQTGFQLPRLQQKQSAHISSGVSSGRSEAESDLSATEYMSEESADEAETSSGVVKQQWSSPFEVVPSATYDRARARILPNTMPSYCIAILHPLSLLPFYGQVKMTVFHGEVKTNGYVTSSDMQSTFLYSPKCSPALCLETSDHRFMFENDNDINKHKLEERLTNVFLKDMADVMIAEVMNEITAHGASVVLLESHSSDRTDYVTSFPVYGDLFEKTNQKWSKSKAQKKLVALAHDIGFNPVRPDDNRNILSIPSVYHNVTQTILQSLSQAVLGRPPIIMLCGWKNVGKSILARHLINSVLNKTNAVCFLDCDVGQTEFNPPTMLGITKVNEPLLGPAFTHNIQPEKMCFFGETNPSSAPDVYLSLLQDLFQHYMVNLQHLPLVVNCMGWMKGLGLCLLVDTINLIEPSHIFQLLPTPQPKSPPILDRKFLQYARGWSKQSIRTPLHRGQWNMRHMILHMPWAVPEVGKYKAANYRELSLLGYLSQLMPTKLKFQKPLPTFDSLAALTPYCVPWESVAVHVCNAEVPQSQLMYVLNASVVGLCKADPAQMMSLKSDDSHQLVKVFQSTPICECLGLGIIRGIDPVNKMFYILTHLSETMLKEINTLLKGSLALPKYVLQQGQRTGLVPYVTSEFQNDITGAGSIKVRYMK